MDVETATKTGIPRINRGPFMDLHEIAEYVVKKGEIDFSGILLQPGHIRDEDLSMEFDESLEKRNEDGEHGLILQGADLRVLKRNHLCLARADLRAADLTGAYIPGADMSRALFGATRLDKADLTGAKFVEAVFEGNPAMPDRASYFRGSRMEGVDFSGAKLNGVYFNGANLASSRFQNASLRDVSFERAELEDTIFREASLKVVGFNKAVVAASCFSGASLEDVSFNKASLRRTYFNGARIKGASFNGADLDCAQFPQSEIEYADFRGANGLAIGMFDEGRVRKPLVRSFGRNKRILDKVMYQN